MFEVKRFQDDTHKLEDYINGSKYRDVQKKRANKLIAQLSPEEKHKALKALSQDELECRGRTVLIQDLFSSNKPSTVPKVKLDELASYSIPEAFQRHFKGILDKISRIANNTENGSQQLIDSLKKKSLSPSIIDNDAMHIKAGEIVKKTVDSFSQLKDSTAFIVKKGLEYNSINSLKEALETPTKWQTLLKLIKKH